MLRGQSGQASLRDLQAAAGYFFDDLGIEQVANVGSAWRPNMIAIGDMNGDWVGDVVVSNQDDDTITIFTVSRKGSVAARTTLSVPAHPNRLAIRDLNGDGKADIVVANSAANTVTVILSTSGK